MMYYSIGQLEQSGQAEDTSAAVQGGGIALTELVSTALPALVESASDPTQQVEVLQAKIANTKQLMRTSPALKNILQARLRTLRAKLKAAQQRQGRQTEAVTATRSYRFLGQAAAITGIALGVALIVRTVAQTKAIGKGK
jgi:hypothetical protein